MSTDNKNNNFKKPDVDEDYLMNIISGDEPVTPPQNNQQMDEPKEIKAKPKEKSRGSSSKKADYEETFLVNRFPSGRSGKVVYIRPEYHERLLRIVQLTREEKTTLYSYIDNILEHHFREFGDDITDYFNERFKPII
ncbi:conjugal transfer protein TraB [Elizabethkingia anophelis]|nr:conjugal transfer protein TraB [Elizabethkingia anophelis]MDV3970147.1 conjugal transfer protein TraB [Elizabethkingia anophelis]